LVGLLLLLIPSPLRNIVFYFAHVEVVFGILILKIEQRQVDVPASPQIRDFVDYDALKLLLVAGNVEVVVLQLSVLLELAMELVFLLKLLLMDFDVLLEVDLFDVVLVDPIHKMEVGLDPRFLHVLVFFHQAFLNVL